jgi:outer membrane receptor protein involved in Fe transport
MHFRRFVLPLILAAGGMAQTTSATVTRSTSFPAVGLASSETAQINVVNLAANPTTGTAASCASSISFVNANGATIGTAKSFTVTAGQAFSATLPYSTTAASGRTLVRGIVSLTVITGSGVGPCLLDSSFETFDTASGASHVYLAGPEISGGRGR